MQVSTCCHEHVCMVTEQNAGVSLFPWHCWWWRMDGGWSQMPRFIVLQTMQLRRRRVNNSWWWSMVWMKINEGWRSRQYREGWMPTQGCIFLPYRTCGTTFFLVGVNVRSFPNHWNVRNVGWIIWWTLWTSCPLHIWTETRSCNNVTTIMYYLIMLGVCGVYGMSLGHHAIVIVSHLIGSGDGIVWSNGIAHKYPCTWDDSLVISLHASCQDIVITQLKLYWM